MFEIFNNVNELTMVFKDNKLVFGNEAALFYFNSYEISILNLDISNFIEADYIEEINQNFKKNKQFELEVMMTIGRTAKLQFKKIVDNMQDEYLLIQANSDFHNEDKLYENAVKVVTPKSLYDPLLMGTVGMIQYELSIPATDITVLIESLFNSKAVKEDPKLCETARLIEEKTALLYEKSRHFIHKLTEIESMYNITKSVFNINDLLKKIEKRLNDYMKMEDIDITICFSSREQEIYISGDYFKISKALVGLLTQSVKYIIASNRKGKIFITTKTDKEEVEIILRDNSIGLDDGLFSLITEADIPILNLDKNSLESHTVNIHLINSYIELNGGSLYFKNEKQKGTTAIARFPLSKKRNLLSEDSTKQDLNILFEEVLKDLHVLNSRQSHHMKWEDSNDIDRK